MQVIQPVSRFTVSMDDLKDRLRMNNNVHVQPAETKTGILDVQLLLDAGLSVPDVFADCSVVRVKYAATTFNTAIRRSEAVYAVHDASGKFYGHYLSSAFKALMK